MHIGDQAYVAFDPPLPNRVRSQPSASADIIGYLEPGEEVEILAGPRCADHWVWWRVRSLRTSLKGWTSEGDMEDYWLVPLLKDQPSRITDDRGVPMALVPAGPFTMGNDPEVGLNECRSLYLGGKCDRSDFTDKQPVHIVSLNSFYIDIYEVTNALYAQCVAEGACQLPTKTRYFNDSQYADHPVIYIRWQDAQTLCQWRTARLPTEAEWEKTARGTDGLIYPWGDRFDGSRGNFCDRNCEYDWANSNFDDGYANTAPVGSYPDGISPYGVFDLVGNVWEWVAD